MRVKPNACCNLWACIREHRGFVAHEKKRLSLSQQGLGQMCVAIFGLASESIKYLLLWGGGEIEFMNES